MRPTALIVWFPLLIYHFWQEGNKLRLITHRYVPIGFVFLKVNLSVLFSSFLHCSFFVLISRALAVLISTIIDCIFYEKVSLLNLRAASTTKIRWLSCCNVFSSVDLGAVQFPEAEHLPRCRRLLWLSSLALVLHPRVCGCDRPSSSFLSSRLYSRLKTVQDRSCWSPLCGLWLFIGETYFFGLISSVITF